MKFFLKILKLRKKNNSVQNNMNYDDPMIVGAAFHVVKSGNKIIITLYDLLIFNV